jgi:hypothetical protein
MVFTIGDYGLLELFNNEDLGHSTHELETMKKGHLE